MKISLPLCQAALVFFQKTGSTTISTAPAISATAMSATAASTTISAAMVPAAATISTITMLAAASRFVAFAAFHQRFGRQAVFARFLVYFNEFHPDVIAFLDEIFYVFNALSGHF